MKPISEFKAIYNPFTRELLVSYGSGVSVHFFEDCEEWVSINYNGDVEHPCYLHIQLDFDEHLQLLFYPRVQGCDELNENLGSYYHYGDYHSDNADCIHIVNTDYEWDEVLLELNLSASDFNIHKKIRYIE